MSRTAGVTCDILLTRIRQTGGLAVDKDFAMSVLSKCQRIVNAGLRRELVSGTLVASSDSPIYRYRETLTTAIDIISIRSGTQELKRIDALNDLSAYDPNWFTTTSGRPRTWCQLGRDLLILYPGSVNHVPNGDMESATPAWDIINTPINVGQTTDQVYAGTYSWKFESNSIGDGIVSSDFTTVTGVDYRLEFWAYSVNTSVKVYVFQGDGAGFNISQNYSITASTWTKRSINFTEASGGASANVGFADPSFGSGIWYLDDVTAAPRVTVTSSRLTTAFSDYVDDYNNTLTLPDEDVEIMLSLAEIILLIRYKQFNEAIGRMKQFKTEFAKYFGVFK